MPRFESARHRRIKRRPCLFESLESRSVLAVGELVASFGNAGVLDVSEWFPGPAQQTEWMNPPPFYADVLVGSDGKMDLVVRNNTNELDWVRFDRNGARDLLFGTGELETTIVRQVKTENSGYIVPSGFMARYASDTTIDTAFGDSGFISFYSQYKLQPDGTAVATYHASSNSFKRIIFDANGRQLPDHGTTTFTIDSPRFQRVWDYRTDANGRLTVLAGASSDDSNGRLMVIRFNQDGALDSSFGEQGYVFTTLTGTPGDVPQFSPQPNGGILVFGIPAATIPHTVKYSLVRYQADGSLDESVGDEGEVKTGFHPIPDSYGPSIVTDSFGNILLIGSETRATAYYPETRTLRRYFPDGTLDEGFSAAAKQTLETHNICQFFDPVMKVVDGKDVVLLLRDGPVPEDDYSCNRTSAILKFSGGDEELLTASRGAVTIDITDLEGNAVTEAATGQSLKVNVLVEDKRDNPVGVFAAYVDLVFGGTDVTVSGPIEYGDHFQNGKSGDIHGQLIDEVGAFGGLEVPTATKLLLFSVVVTLDKAGPLTVKAEAADESPTHRTLLYGQANTEQIRVNYRNAEITVKDPIWHNQANPADTNKDGLVTPMDVLLLINMINRGAMGHVAEVRSNMRSISSAELSFSQAAFVDVDNDSYLAPNDVLMVINVINTPRRCTQIRGAVQYDQSVYSYLTLAPGYTPPEEPLCRAPIDFSNW